MKFLLFTDLDGTLLDHKTYEATAALPALAALKSAGIPVIFCSSKTFAEQRFYQQKLDIRAPFVIENGSAACIPDGYFKNSNFLPIDKKTGLGFQVFAKTDASKIRLALADAAEKTGLKTRGFAQAADAELALATGLSGKSLARARDRWFTETLLSPAADDFQSAEILQKTMAAQGLTLVRGGRFWTVQDEAAGKGVALRWLAGVFERAFSEKIPTVAIGDSGNDVPMLRAADLAFLVQKPSSDWAKIQFEGLQKIRGAGPAGFSAAAFHCLEMF